MGATQFEPEARERAVISLYKGEARNKLSNALKVLDKQPTVLGIKPGLSRYSRIYQIRLWAAWWCYLVVNYRLFWYVGPTVKRLGCYDSLYSRGIIHHLTPRTLYLMYLKLLLGAKMQLPWYGIKRDRSMAGHSHFRSGNKYLLLNKCADCSRWPCSPIMSLILCSRVWPPLPSFIWISMILSSSSRNRRLFMIISTRFRLSISRTSWGQMKSKTLLGYKTSLWTIHRVNKKTSYQNFIPLLIFPTTYSNSFLHGDLVEMGCGICGWCLKCPELHRMISGSSCTTLHRGSWDSQVVHVFKH